MKWINAIKNPPPLHQLVLLFGVVRALPAELGIPAEPAAYLGWRWEASNPKRQNYALLSRHVQGRFPAITDVTHWAPRPGGPKVAK